MSHHIDVTLTSTVDPVALRLVTSDNGRITSLLLTIDFITSLMDVHTIVTCLSRRIYPVSSVNDELTCEELRSPDRSTFMPD
jgi:hypothetical protein